MKPNPPPTSPSPSSTALPRIVGLYALALAIWGAGSLATRALAEADAGRGGLRLAIAIASALPLFVIVWIARRILLRDLDELAQRVILEGCALALALFVPLAALWCNLRSAGVDRPRLDPPDIVMTPAVLVLLGVAVAWKRFR